MHALRYLLDRITGLFTLVAALLTLAMMLHVSADVIGRTVFHRPLVGTIEIVSAYYMAALAFLPLALITRERGHIIVELFTGWMSWRPRKWMDAFAAVLSVVYVTVFTWQAVIVAVEMTGMREAREAGGGFIEVWPSRWVVPIGFGLMAVYLVIHLVRDTRAAARNMADADDPARDAPRAEAPLKEEAQEDAAAAPDARPATAPERPE
ncbi:TRAP transporter small permease [Oceanicella sp. SM1341]|uniref:TRAP transporter small permease n=1 Tax=Oceanicella sp. SM1341 TaxID=1548889 RepID=UPI0013001EEA|nr:TRAP transporter small permease [Oceanicella sp. SM1341]